MIQLIEYGVHSGADPEQSGRALFITLFLQCLVLAIGVFLFINGEKESDNISTQQNVITMIAGWNLALFAVVFIAALIISFTLDFSAAPGSSGHIEWYMNGHSFFGNWSWLYLLGIFGPLVMLLGFYNWADLPVAILIVYGLLSLAYVIGNYPPEALTSMYCYLSIGWTFLVYWLGIIPDCDKTTC